LSLPGDEEGIPGTRARPAGEWRRDPKCYGSVAFVTGAFGLAAAAAVVHGITGVRPRTARLLPDAERKRRRKPTISRAKRRDG
jgi:heme exporter protein D